MREIKFRAWDDVRKEMYYGYDIYNPMPQGFSELVPMQYTGVDDKHGKSIYEGDILGVENGAGLKAEYIHARVEWRLSGFGLVKPKAKNSVLNMEIPAFARYKTEVIGNIYENEELIK